MEKIMKNFNIGLVAILASFLVACGGWYDEQIGVTEAELSSASYGEEPSNYKQVIRDYMTPTLIDSESVRYTNFSKPQKDWLSEFAGYSIEKHFGWLVCVEINGKNSYGGFTGRKQYYFLIKDNRVIFTQKDNPLKSIGYAQNHPIQCHY